MIRDNFTGAMQTPPTGIGSLGARIGMSPLLSNSRSRYLAIVETIEEDIEAARLRPGDRLPTQRDLAVELGIAIGTISRAYTEAKRRGLISGEVGRGTFVAMPSESSLVGAVDPPAIDLRVFRIVPEPGVPVFAATLKSLAARPDLGEILGYQEAAGKLHYRAAGAAWVGRTGLNVGPERILVCNGAQHAMAVALGTLAVPRDVVLTEELNYPGIRLLERLYHLRMQGVACDSEGRAAVTSHCLSSAAGGRPAQSQATPFIRPC